MARRPFSRGSGRGSPRRLTSWSLGPGGDDIATLDRVAVTGAATVIIGSGVTPVVPNLTIVRTRGFLEFTLRTADAVLAGFNYVVGIGVIQADPFAVGAGSLPDPFTDADWPGWLYFHAGSMRTGVGALAVGDPSVNPFVLEIDSKSMRKLRLNEVMFMVVQVGESSAATMDIAGLTRVLVKLP